MKIKTKMILAPLLIAAGSAFTALPANAADIEKLRAEALKILDDGCARCHEAGKLEGRKEPAHNFGNVLDLEAMARDKKYVIPGNPDNSKLWKSMMDGTMPYDVYNGDFEAHSPTAEDIEKVAEWIRAEGDATKEMLASRDFVSDDDMLEAITSDLRKLPDHRVKRTRYITLANLYNGGATEEAMEVYRQGAMKLVNSLNYEPDPVRYEKFGPADTILRINLDDMGWDDEKWDLLQSKNPFLVKYDSPLAELVEEQTDTKAPFLRADVFAFVASRPLLYNKLLDLPDTFQELQKMLEFDLEEEIAANRVARAGFQRSGVSQNNRLIERIPTKFGAFWNSYDFAGNDGKQSLFLHPLGPDGPEGFEHDGGEMFWTLPNGMQAYYLSTETGKMLISGPTEIVRDQRRRDLKVTNGISCMSCHALGIRDENQDEIRDYVLKSATFDTETRKRVEALYPPQEEMKRLMARDKKRFMDAMKEAGLDPNLMLDGQHEMISALSDQFERNLTLEMAAAEFGMSVEQFEESAPRAGKEGFDLIRRLKQDQVPRDQFSGVFADLVDQMTDNKSIAEEESEEAPKVVKKEREEAHENFDLALFSDQDKYKVDDKATFTVRSDKACFLTLVNVDSNGVSTVLVPNRFDKSAVKLKPGEKFVFPGKKDKFQFRLADAGKEKVIALCSTTHKFIPGIDYDFKKAAFAEQGSERSLNAKLGKAAEQYTRAIKVEKTGGKEKKRDKKPVAQSRKSITILVKK